MYFISPRRFNKVTQLNIHNIDDSDSDQSKDNRDLVDLNTS